MIEYKDVLKPLYTQAVQAGACNKFKGNETLEELIALFKSPQGIEFCINKHFPNMSTLRMFRSFTDLTKYGIYLDANVITLHDPEYVVLIGKTSASINIKSCKNLHQVVAMHGAKCTINASGWSVTKTECGQGSIIIKNCTDGALIL